MALFFGICSGVAVEASAETLPEATEVADFPLSLESFPLILGGFRPFFVLLLPLPFFYLFSMVSSCRFFALLFRRHHLVSGFKLASRWISCVAINAVLRRIENE